MAVAIAQAVEMTVAFTQSGKLAVTLPQATQVTCFTQAGKVAVSLAQTSKMNCFT